MNSLQMSLLPLLAGVLGASAHAQTYSITLQGGAHGDIGCPAQLNLPPGNYEVLPYSGTIQWIFSPFPNQTFSTQDFYFTTDLNDPNNNFLVTPQDRPDICNPQGGPVHFWPTSVCVNNPVVSQFYTFTGALQIQVRKLVDPTISTVPCSGGSLTPTLTITRSGCEWLVRLTGQPLQFYRLVGNLNGAREIITDSNLADIPICTGGAGSLFAGPLVFAGTLPITSAPTTNGSMSWRLRPVSSLAGLTVYLQGYTHTPSVKPPLFFSGGSTDAFRIQL